MDINKMVADISSRTIDINNHFGKDEADEHNARYDVERRGEIFYLTSICSLTLMARTKEELRSDEFIRQLLDATELLLMTELPSMFTACVAKFNEKEWEFDVEPTVARSVRSCDVKLTHLLTALRQYLSSRSVDGIGPLPDAVEFVVFCGLVIKLEETKYMVIPNLKVEIRHLDVDGTKKIIDLM